MVNTLFYDPKRSRSEIMNFLFKAPLTIAVNGGGGGLLNRDVHFARALAHDREGGIKQGRGTRLP